MSQVSSNVKKYGSETSNAAQILPIVSMLGTFSPPLDLTDIRNREIGSKGEILLTPFLGETQLPDPFRSMLRD